MCVGLFSQTHDVDDEIVSDSENSIVVSPENIFSALHDTPAMPFECVCMNIWFR